MLHRLCSPAKTWGDLTFWAAVQCLSGSPNMSAQRLFRLWSCVMWFLINGLYKFYDLFVCWFWCVLLECNILVKFLAVLAISGAHIACKWKGQKKQLATRCGQRKISIVNFRVEAAKMQLICRLRLRFRKQNTFLPALRAWIWTNDKWANLSVQLGVSAICNLNASWKCNLEAN